MSAQLIIETVGAVAGCLAVWLVPSYLLSQQMDALRAEMTQRIDGLAAQQRQDHQHLVSLILQTRGIREMESQP